MCTQKIVYNNHVLVTKAALALRDVNHVVLGTAIVVEVNRYTTNQVANVCHQYGGYMANEVTQYDEAKLIGA